MLNEMMIRCFLQVARTLNFTKSAEQLFISQQACSKNIRKLEEDIGCILFDRTTKQTALTDEGKAFYEFFSSAGQSFNELHNRILKPDYTAFRSFRIGMTSNLDGAFLALALDKLRMELSELSVEWKYAAPFETIERLGAGDVDVVITLKSLIPSLIKITCTEIIKIPQLIVISKKNPYAGLDPRSIHFEKGIFGTTASVGRDEPDAYSRSRELLNNLGIAAQRIRLYPDIDSVHFAAEMGDCFTICLANDPFWRKSTMLSVPLGVDESIVCVSKKNTVDSVVLSFLKYIKTYCNAF